LVRQNADLIIDNFMHKYIFNAIGLEISKDEDSAGDQSNRI